MSKKVIITISSIVAILVLIALICLLFIVGDIKVMTTSELLLSNEEKDSIVKDSKIIKHSSIFSLSEDIAIENIEKENPKLKVVKIERKIPNKVVINVSSRVGILAIPISEGGYWIIDRELKVIDRVEKINNQYVALIHGIVVEEGVDITKGMFLEGNEWIRNIITGLENCSFIGKRFGSFINEITYNENKTISLKTNSGVEFIIPYQEKELTIKIIKNEYKKYLTLNVDQRTHGKIILDLEGIKYIP